MSYDDLYASMMDLYAKGDLAQAKQIAKQIYDNELTPDQAKNVAMVMRNGEESRASDVLAKLALLDELSGGLKEGDRVTREVEKDGKKGKVMGVVVRHTDGSLMVRITGGQGIGAGGAPVGKKYALSRDWKSMAAHESAE
jgi:hypothetical protein